MLFLALAGATGRVADESPAHASSRSRGLPLYKDKVIRAIIATGLLILGAALLLESYLGNKREVPPEKVSEPTRAEKPVAVAKPAKDVFPDSSSRFLADSDLQGVSTGEFQQAINEIFARHGYTFSPGSIYTGSGYNQKRVFDKMNPYEQSNVWKLLHAWRRDVANNLKN